MAAAHRHGGDGGHRVPAGVGRLAAFVVAALLLTAALPANASAQDTYIPPPDRPVARLGPLTIQPRFSLRRIGVDTNVFNSAEDPVRDWTVAASPGTDLWLRVGALRVASRTRADLVYFRRATTERSASLSQDVRVDAPLGRVTPFAFVERVTSHDRPNIEIDARLRQTRTGVMAGGEVVMGTRLRVAGSLRQTDIAFETDERLGQVPRDALNRRARDARLEARYQMTPISALAVRLTQSSDRFTQAPDRDLDSVGIWPGIDFRPTGPLTGRVFVGVRRFTARRAAIAPARALVADTAVSYVWRNTTRLTAAAGRDLDYTLADAVPYVMNTGVSLALTQAVGSYWDVTGSLGRTVRDAFPTATAGLTWREVTRNVGAGYHASDRTRLGVQLTHVRRATPAATAEFGAWSFGGTIRYGF